MRILQLLFRNAYAPRPITHENHAGPVFTYTHAGPVYTAYTGRILHPHTIGGVAHIHMQQVCLHMPT